MKKIYLYIGLVLLALAGYWLYNRNGNNKQGQNQSIIMSGDSSCLSSCQNLCETFMCSEGGCTEPQQQTIQPCLSACKSSCAFGDNSFNIPKRYICCVEEVCGWQPTVEKTIDCAYGCVQSTNPVVDSCLNNL